MKPSTLGRWCPRPQKHFKLAMASRRVAFNGNTSLIARLSNYNYIIVRLQAKCAGLICCTHQYYRRQWLPNNERMFASIFAGNATQHNVQHIGENAALVRTKLKPASTWLLSLAMGTQVDNSAVCISYEWNDLRLVLLWETYKCMVFIRWWFTTIYKS